MLVIDSRQRRKKRRRRRRTRRCRGAVLASSKPNEEARGEDNEHIEPVCEALRKLRQSSSYRRSFGSALVVGLTPIMFQESQNDEPPIVDCLLLLDGAVSPKGLDDFYTSLVHVSPNVMKKLSGMQSINSIEGITLMRIPRSFYDMDVNQEEEIHWSCFHSPHQILVPDGIQD